MKLLLLFTVIPLVELFLLMKVSAVLGLSGTIGLVLLTGVVGAALARREGLALLVRLQKEMEAGFPTGNRVVEGLLILLGGVLLITPGVLTDFVGLVLVFPWTRRALAPRLKDTLLSRAQVSGNVMHFGGLAPNSEEPPKPFDHPVS